MQPSSILICSMRLIGDVILTTPLIGLLRAAYPDASIDLLVTKKTGEFLEKDPRVRRVIYHSQFDVDKNVRIKGRGYFRQIFRQYDLAINMNASDRGNIAVLMAAKHKRVAFYEGESILKNFWKRLFFSNPIKQPLAIHRACLCKLVADALEIKVERLEAKVFWDESDEEKVDGILRGRGAGERFFVIHPFARWRYKYWDLERFVQVSDAIAQKYGLKPVWTSSPLREEVELLRRTADKCRHKPVMVAGELDLNQMTCLLSRASLYLGLDTAVSHLAATTGIPMVVLFGPTPADIWSPWDNTAFPDRSCAAAAGQLRSGNMLLLQKDWECLPCGRMGCEGKTNDSPCLMAIEPEEVMAAVDEVMCGSAPCNGPKPMQIY